MSQRDGFTTQYQKTRGPSVRACDTLNCDTLYRAGTSYTYTYDLQNRLLSKAGTDGTTAYAYDAAWNLLKETSPDGLVSYTYTAQNKLETGTNAKGETSTYTYNALGVRIQNVQVRR